MQDHNVFRNIDSTAKPMSRYKASLIHLLISALLVSNVFGLVFWVWYPTPAFEAVGAFSIIRLLIGVDLVLGPALTLIVFKPGKPGLKFDLTVIALMQIVALVYGTYTLFKEKPDYMVFAIDRLEFVSKNLVDQSEIRYEELRSRQVTALIPVFARQPEDPAEFQSYLDSIMFEGKPDLEARPEYWEPWAAGVDVIREQMKSMDELVPATAEDEEKIQNAIEKYTGEHPDIGLLPVGSIEDDLGIILDRNTLEVLGTLYVNPWATRAQE
jgi:hypothetical protein